MKLCKMIEVYLKCDNMNIIRTINAFNCINNHVNTCIKCMLSGRQNDTKRMRGESQERKREIV